MSHQCHIGVTSVARNILDWRKTFRAKILSRVFICQTPDLRNFWGDNSVCTRENRSLTNGAKVPFFLDTGKEKDWLARERHDEINHRQVQQQHVWGLLKRLRPETLATSRKFT